MTIDNSANSQSGKTLPGHKSTGWTTNSQDHPHRGGKKVKRISNISNSKHLHGISPPPSPGPMDRRDLTCPDRPRELLSTLSNKWCSALETASLALCDSDCTRTRTGQLQIDIIFREKNAKTDKHCAFQRLIALKSDWHIEYCT